MILRPNTGGRIMFHIGAAASRNCQGISRREILQVGGIGLLGLTLADWWTARANQGNTPNREPSCIFIFLSGGPSHLETFDPKPRAPIEIRGPYGTIPTNVSGIQISELLPQIARHMDKCALIRTMTGAADAHSGTAMLSGANRAGASYGAVLQRLLGSRSGMPPF